MEPLILRIISRRERSPNPVGKSETTLITIVIQYHYRQMQKYIEPFEKQFQELNKSKKKKHYVIRRYFTSGIYEGNVNMFGHPTGYAKLYKNDGSLFLGQFSDGKANSKGVLILQNGDYLKGSFHENMIKQGEYGTKQFTYTGNFQDNLFHGEGKQVNHKENHEFNGKYQKGEKVSGQLKWIKDNTTYEYAGKFEKDGSFAEKGKLTEESYGTYEGEFMNNLKHGKGTYQYFNGLKYVGQYYEGKKEGRGILYNGNGKISYDGEFKEGLPHGEGKAYDKQGNPLKSNWVLGIDSKIIEG